MQYVINVIINVQYLSDVTGTMLLVFGPAESLFFHLCMIHMAVDSDLPGEYCGSANRGKRV